MENFNSAELVDSFYSTFLKIQGVEVWGISLGQSLMAVIILLIIVFRQFITGIILNRIKKMASKTKTTLDDELIDSMAKPLSFVPVIFVIYFTKEFLDVSRNISELADKLMGSVAILIIFWILFNVIKPLTRFIEKLENIFDKSFISWTIKAVKISFVFIGAATILEIWGIKIGPIIAGLGLFGVAVALGAQDLFKNLISGILILSERRFTMGDWVKVDGVVEGTVENIGFRSTRIRRFDKSPVYVPNAHLSDNCVTNFSSMTFRRISWTIGLEYRTKAAQIKKIRDEIKSFLMADNDFVNPPEAPLFVYVDKFSDSSIDLMLYCFTHTTQWKLWLEIKERLALKIMEIVDNADAAFAFPSQSVYVETFPDEQKNTNSVEVG